MSELIKAWQATRAVVKIIVAQAEGLEQAALAAANEAPVPHCLRPATAADVVPGAIIWYPGKPGREFYYWKEVETVLHPDDDFKAYRAPDGSRYGLAGAWVEAPDV